MSLKLIGGGAPVVPDKPQAVNDDSRPLGSRAVLNGRPVLWGGPGWGWQSEKSFQKLQSSGKLNRSFFSDPIGVIGNELRYVGQQIQKVNRQRPRVGRVGTMNLYQDANTGELSRTTQSNSNLTAAMTVGAAENAAKLFNAARREDGNPESGRVGNAIESVSELGYRLLGATPPAQQNEFEQGLDATARSAAVSVVGTVVGAKIVPAMGAGLAGAALTGGARWAVGELLSTYLDDNRSGNIFNLVGALTGTEIPLSVDIGNDGWIDAATKSLIPNALPGTIISALGGVGQLARNPGAIGAGMKNTRRALRSQRKVAEVTSARVELERAGVTQTDPATGATAWRQAEAEFKSSIGIEDEAAAPAAASTTGLDQLGGQLGAGVTKGARQQMWDAYSAGKTKWSGVEDPALRAAQSAGVPSTDRAAFDSFLDQYGRSGGGPSAAASAPEPRPIPTIEGEITTENFARTQPAPLPQVEDVSVDPWSIRYDPELPEADVVFNLVRDLDDDQLQMLVAQPGPVVERLDQMLQAREAMPVRPELQRGAVMAPSDNIAERLGPDGQPVPYEATLEAMPMDTLRSVAAPDNNPELSQLIGDLTGREWEEFTKADIIEGLAAYREQSGQSLLVRDWNQGMRPTAEIAADPERFQFKQGVNEQGEQLGSSLAGVERWDTNAEGVLDVWTDPADGRTYVVNGHNRLARAQQLGVPTVPVRELPAATAQEARAMGALSNIQAGQGTVFDAAKFMRDSGITSPDQLQQLGVPMSSGNAARGLALAQLPDNIFQAAVDGRLSIGKAAALGGSGLDETQMQTAFKALGGQDMSDAKFAEMVAQVRSAPVVQGDQVDLFGNTEAMSLMSQKADLVVKIRSDLLKDKRFFSTAARGADRLEQAGNTINVAGNKAIAADTTQVLAMFDELKYTEGPVSDLLNDGARQIAEGAKPGVIADRIRGDIAEAVRRSLEEQGMPAPRVPASPEAELPAARTLEPEERKALRIEAIRKAVDEAEVRPPETPIPDLPDGPAVSPRVARADIEARGGELEPGTPGAQAMADEIRLATEYFEQDAQLRAVAEEGARDAASYELFTFEQKKTQGLADGYDAGPSVADLFEQNARAMAQSDARLYRSAGKRLQRVKGLVDDLDAMEGDPALAPAPARPEPLQLTDGIPAAIDIPASAHTKLSPSKVQGKAEMLYTWGNAGFIAKESGPVKSLDQARALVEAKGRNLDVDKIPGINFDKAINDLSMGRTSPDTEAVAAAYRQFYGVPEPVSQRPRPRDLAPAPARPEPMQLTDSTPPTFALPKELTRSAPRYGQASIRFGSDLDKAAYILANDAVRPSKAAPKFREAIEAAGLDVGEVIAHGKKVKAAIKQAAGGGAAPKKSGTIELPAQRFNQGNEGPQALARAADLEARKQIQANNRQMDDIRRKAQQEGC
jgi:hypothetical protein